jgi:hypothetical protein
MNEAALRDMGAQAKPLTAYNGGKIPSAAREIKIFGARQRSDAEKLMIKIGHPSSDQSSVETGDADRLQYFVTHHGIPVFALNGFEDYRRNYEALSAKPDDPNSRYAIFHLDNERENSPHDPGSVYFVNHEDIEMRFARALAYGWIIQSPTALIDQINGDSYDKAALYVYPQASFRPAGESSPASLFDYMVQFAQQQARELVNQMNTLTEAIKQMGEDDTEKMREERRLEQYLRQLTALRQYFPLLDGVQPAVLLTHPLRLIASGIYAASSESDKLYRIILAGRNNPPISLNLALEALYADKERLLPNLFIRAFDAAYKHVSGYEKTFNVRVSETLSGRLEAFLDERGILEKGKVDTRWFTEIGQAGRPLEQRLCNLLLVYHRAYSRLVNGERYFHEEVRVVREAAQPQKRASNSYDSGANSWMQAPSGDGL